MAVHRNQFKAAKTAAHGVIPEQFLSGFRYAGFSSVNRTFLGKASANRGALEQQQPKNARRRKIVTLL